MVDQNKTLDPNNLVYIIKDVSRRVTRKYARKQYPPAITRLPKFYVDATAHAVANKVPDDVLTAGDDKTSIKIDTTTGTATTYGELVGTPDGTLDIFVTEEPYVPDTLQIYVDTGELFETDDYVQTNPALGQFQIVNPPLTGSVVIASYVRSDADAGIVISQTGAGGVYPLLKGAVDGVNKVYMCPSPYVSGSLKIYINGMLQTQGTMEDWVEDNPSGGTFEMAIAPTSGDVVTAIYSASSGKRVKDDTITGTLDGRVDGTNALFTCRFSYLSGKIEVMLNSQLLTAGVDFIETSPSAGTFTLSSNALSGDKIQATYKVGI